MTEKSHTVVAESASTELEQEVEQLFNCLMTQVTAAIRRYGEDRRLTFRDPDSKYETVTDVGNQSTTLYAYEPPEEGWRLFMRKLRTPTWQLHASPQGEFIFLGKKNVWPSSPEDTEFPGAHMEVLRFVKTKLQAIHAALNLFEARLKNDEAKEALRQVTDKIGGIHDSLHSLLSR